VGDTAISSTDDEMLESIKSLIESKQDGSVFESGIDRQMTNNATAPYVIGTYSKDSLFGKTFKFVELLTDIRLPNNKLVVVEYQAEQNDFDKYLPKIKQVINSISPINSTG
jgi:hypothetical protein